MDKQVFTSYSLDEISDALAVKIKQIVKEELNSQQALGGRSNLIKANEACRILQISTPTLYDWMRKGHFKGYYIESRLFFKRNEIENAIKQ